jgi:hypothetical protein
LFKEDVLQVGEVRKVAIMRAKASGQFPHTFDGVEIGAIRRKEEKGQKTPMLMEPSPEFSGVVPSGVVQDEYNLSTRPMEANQPDQEGMKGFRVESVRLGSQ